MRARSPEVARLEHCIASGSERDEFARALSDEAEKRRKENKLEEKIQKTNRRRKGSTTLGRGAGLHIGSTR